MQQRPVRSRTGCLTCRQRRKKCDEQRPRCATCIRLRLPCKWRDASPKPTNSVPITEPISQRLREESTNRSRNSTLGSLRVADHDGIAREALELPPGIVEMLSGRYAALETTKREELRHTLITGVLKGWSYIPEETRSTDLWSKMVLFDHQMQRSGQGMVARLATSLVIMAMHQHLVAPNSSSEWLVMDLPAWYLPKKPYATQGPESFINFVPWPGVRELFTDDPLKYLNDHFINMMSSQAVRIVWPYSADAAIATSTTTGNLCFTDEFLLRVGNLRSFATTADFLNRYPEFRGRTPQLEPSLTFYQPESAEYLEDLYWRILRERARGGRSLDGVEVLQNTTDSAYAGRTESAG